MVKSIGLRSGVMEKTALLEDGRGQRRPVKETHGFRKFFQTTAINAGMSPSLKCKHFFWFTRYLSLL